ncbi:MAG: hypothetical protein Tsb0015_01790 [Simkaniaceae bacterium]
MKISVIILTKNNEKTIKRALDSTLSFEEVIILDSESTDDTYEIAKTYDHVQWHSHPFLGFGPMRQLAEKHAKNDWILSLDSDEAISPQLINDLKNLKLIPNCIYSIPRHNFFRDKWIKWCGWYPDRQMRLYNKRKTGYSSSLVHEGILTDNMQIIALNSPVFHYSYEKIEDFLAKMQMYSSLFAKENTGKKRSSLLHAMGHGLYAFFKSYFLKKGFLGGEEGFIISLYNAHTAFYKYLKLSEANRRFGHEDLT